MDGPIEEIDFDPAIDAHYRNCFVAEAYAHGTGAIEVRRADETLYDDGSGEEPISGLARYLSTNVPGLDCRGSRTMGILDDPNRGPDGMIRGGAVLDYGEIEALRLSWQDIRRGRTGTAGPMVLHRSWADDDTRSGRKWVDAT